VIVLFDKFLVVEILTGEVLLLVDVAENLLDFGIVLLVKVSIEDVRGFVSKHYQQEVGAAFPWTERD
jgi:hypothetical protein